MPNEFSFCLKVLLQTKGDIHGYKNFGIHGYKNFDKIKDINKKKTLKCNYRCMMLNTDFSTNCAPNSKHRYFNYCAENKGLECTIAYNNIESMFPNHVFFISTLCNPANNWPINLVSRLLLGIISACYANF